MASRYQLTRSPRKRRAPGAARVQATDNTAVTIGTVAPVADAGICAAVTGTDAVVVAVVSTASARAPLAAVHRPHVFTGSQGPAQEQAGPGPDTCAAGHRRDARCHDAGHHRRPV